MPPGFPLTPASCLHRPTREVNPLRFILSTSEDYDMNMRNMLCRLLIALMIWTPFQLAQAAMIGTDQVASVSKADRTALLNTLSRSDVASQLQLLGIDPALAKERVQAMTDDEASALANRLDSLPAGGISDAAAVLLIILIAAGVWWYLYKR